MTQQEFKNQFPVGSIISYVPGMQYVRSGAREIFRIDKYVKHGENLFMRGILVVFNFQTTKYKKEYTTEDLSKWHMIDCNDEIMEGANSVGCLCFNFNKVRLADEKELSIFRYCINNYG